MNLFKCSISQPSIFCPSDFYVFLSCQIGAQSLICCLQNWSDHVSISRKISLKDWLDWLSNLMSPTNAFTHINFKCHSFIYLPFDSLDYLLFWIHFGEYFPFKLRNQKNKTNVVFISVFIAFIHCIGYRLVT